MVRATLAVALAVLLMTSCALPVVGGDTITLEVRNNLDGNATLVITESQMQVSQADARMIAAPIVVPPGDHQVLLVSPDPVWSLELRGVEGFFDSQDLHEWQEEGPTRLIIEEQGLSVEHQDPSGH